MRRKWPPAVLEKRAEGMTNLRPRAGTVCVAVHSPRADLLERQIRSIAAQSLTDWECLVGIDGYNPQTLRLLQVMVAGDSRFRLLEFSSNVGFYRNFERILREVDPKSAWVALADQDDEWYPHKLELLVSSLERDQSLAVAGQARVVSAEGGLRAVTRRRESCLLSLIYDNQVTGSFAVFARGVIELALPFPEPTDSSYHDHWLGVCAKAAGGVRILPDIVQDYVQHGGNALGEDTGINWRTRLDRLRSKGLNLTDSLDYLAIHRWGWRVLIAREIRARIPRALDDRGIRTLAIGRNPLLPICHLLAYCLRGEVPPARGLGLALGAAWAWIRWVSRSPLPGLNTLTREASGQ